MSMTMSLPVNWSGEASEGQCSDAGQLEADTLDLDLIREIGFQLGRDRMDSRCVSSRRSMLCVARGAISGGIRQSLADHGLKNGPNVSARGVAII